MIDIRRVDRNHNHRKDDVMVHDNKVLLVRLNQIEHRIEEFRFDSIEFYSLLYN